MKLALEFSSTHSPEHRSRLRYALQVFCAIYGHVPVLVDDQHAAADVWLSYAGDNSRAPRNTVHLFNGYRPRALALPSPQPCPVRIGDSVTALFYPPDHSSEPDWLGEIFEWISVADEYSVSARDSVGRIPFEQSVFSRYKLDQRTPYAALAMRSLQRALCRLIPRLKEEPSSPFAHDKQAIVCTHDVDFIPLSYFSTFRRTVKNSGAALRRSPKLAFLIAARALLFALRQAEPLWTPQELAAFDRQLEITASFFFIARHGHRRDANYTLCSNIALNIMHTLEQLGMEVGVHGSYQSLETDGGLSEEFEIMRELGFSAAGGRQHWLRFTLDRLIAAVEKAGAAYDCSLGWSDQIGFRAGACFAFPPYNFAEERPASFLELPLAIMDQALPQTFETAAAAVSNLLETSRKYAWGGISVLWHPTAFGGGQLAPAIGCAYEVLVQSQSDMNIELMSAAEFMSRVRGRYVQVGLLEGMRGIGVSDVGHEEVTARAGTE
jgi:hypothetical protein